jgi:hypothetical protein
VGELSGSIIAFLAERNKNAKRYVWLAKGEDILRKVEAARRALAVTATAISHLSRMCSNFVTSNRPGATLDGHTPTPFSPLSLFQRAAAIADSATARLSRRSSISLPRSQDPMGQTFIPREIRHLRVCAGVGLVLPDAPFDRTGTKLGA